MNSEEFIRAIKLYVRDVAISGVIENLQKPPGRRPPEKDLVLSGWYNGLNETESGYLKSIITEAVDEAIFGFLVAIDGDRRIVDDEIDSYFELYFVGRERGLLNEQNEVRLHDLYNEN